MNYIYKYDLIGKNEYIIFPLKSDPRYSEIFIFNDPGSTLNSININSLKNGRKIEILTQVSTFLALNTTLIFSSKDNTELFVSYDSGNTFNTHKFKFKISKIYYTNDSREFIVVSDIANNVILFPTQIHFTKTSKWEWKEYVKNVKSFSWYLSIKLGIRKENIST